MKTYTLKIPDALAAKLESQAKKAGETKSYIIREALAEYLVMPEKMHAQSPSIADLAADIFGSCDGPSDLSTNPKYMEGYGE